MDDNDMNDIKKYVMDTYTEECRKAFTFSEKAKAYKRLPKAFRSEWMNYLLQDDDVISFISVMMDMILAKVVSEARFAEKGDSYKEMYGGKELNKQMNEMKKGDAEKAVEIFFGHCFSMYKMYFFNDMEDTAYDKITLCGMEFLFDSYRERADMFRPAEGLKTFIDYEA